ncbi:hypothetical protein EYF80_004481 [Liparis tanakae]|uniref:Uncharacterized protein n=1 Tax=Liparis tanakae TaxID=230148 RepID=A0A4Z2J5B6_9TELE|nr:hypothetical protein EYF80_004481 [Liparis tanakae]
MRREKRSVRAVAAEPRDESYRRAPEKRRAGELTSRFQSFHQESGWRRSKMLFFSLRQYPRLVEVHRRLHSSGFLVPPAGKAVGLLKLFTISRMEPHLSQDHYSHTTGILAWQIPANPKTHRHVAANLAYYPGTTLVSASSHLCRLHDCHDLGRQEYYMATWKEANTWTQLNARLSHNTGLLIRGASKLSLQKNQDWLLWWVLIHVQVKTGNYCEVCVHLEPPVSAGLVKGLSFGLGVEKCPWDWIWSCE